MSHDVKIRILKNQNIWFSWEIDWWIFLKLRFCETAILRKYCNIIMVKCIVKNRLRLKESIHNILLCSLYLGSSAALFSSFWACWLVHVCNNCNTVTSNLQALLAKRQLSEISQVEYTLCFIIWFHKKYKKYRVKTLFNIIFWIFILKL